MNAKDIINLNGQDFPLGSSGLVRINAGKLPSGNRISIFTYIFRIMIIKSSRIIKLRTPTLQIFFCYA